MFILLKFGFRYLKKHLLQTLLLILGVALGVAVVISIDLANISATRAFRISTESMTGKATHQLISGKLGFDESIYTKIRTELGFRNSAPVVEDYVAVKEFNNKAFRVFGVDPFAEPPFRNYISEAGDKLPINAISNFLTKPNSIMLEENSAIKNNLKVGSEITIEYRTIQKKLTIGALLRAKDDLSKQALENIIITDISTAQEILNKVGKLSHIDLLIDEKTPEGQNTLTKIKELLPQGVYLETPQMRSASLEQMSNAFELNLSALSMLALVVGMFLIYNTITFSVVQRRNVIGILRALGVTRVQIFTMIITETIILSLIGVLIGSVLGIILGQGALYFVTRTINDLYFTLNTTNVYVSNFTLIKGSFVGIFASLFACLIPAIEATRVDPVCTMKRSNLENKVEALLPLITLIGIVLGTIGTGIFFIPTKNIVVSFTGLFTVIIAVAFLVPIFTTLLMKLLTPITSAIFGITGRISPRNIVRSLSRSTVAIAALMVAVSVIVGVSIMIGSFRQTVVTWLDSTLTADIFISSHTESKGLDDSFALALTKKIEKIKGINKVETARSVRIITKNYGSILLSAVSNDIAEKRRYSWFAGSKDNLWNEVKSGKVMVSESFAYHNALKAKIGNVIKLETPKGEKTFEVVAIYYDYASDRGTVLIDAENYIKLWNDRQITSIAAFLEKDFKANDIIPKIEQVMGNNQNITVQSNVQLRDSALDVFDRTFAITQALRILSTLVAFVGVFSTLMSLQLERTREIGVLRAIGMTTRQVQKTILIETGLMGISAGILALPLGIILAVILIYVINIRSFGWALELIPKPEYFVQAIGIALLSSLLAGIYPALRINKIKPSEAVRSE